MSRYPKNWNTSFPEWHPDALSSEAVHAVHDIYAAVAILCLHFKFKDGDQNISKEFFKNGKEPTPANYHPRLIDKWSKIISSAAFESWLVSHGDALEQKTSTSNEEYDVEMAGSPLLRQGQSRRKLGCFMCKRED